MTVNSYKSTIERLEYLRRLKHLQRQGKISNEVYAHSIQRAKDEFQKQQVAEK